MANTYVALATANTTGTVSSYTFSSISASYTHLYITAVGSATTPTYGFGVQFNGVTGSYYYGSGRMTAFYTPAVNNAWSSGQLVSGWAYDGWSTTVRGGYAKMIFPYYRRTNTKMLLAHFTSGDFRETTVACGGVNDGAVLTSITVLPSGTTFVDGTTLTLYGILKA